MLSPTGIVGLLFLFIAIFLKEVVYFFIVLFMAAGINDKSHALMLAMGSKVWNDNADLRRIQAYVNYTSRPLHWALLGFKPSLNSAILQAVGYCAVILISVLRTILVHSVVDG